MIEFKVLQAPDRLQVGSYMHWFTELSVGSSEADFILDDPEIAPQHIIVAWQNNQAIVQNCSSTPLKVNAILISPGQSHALQPGDRVNLGKSQLQFLRINGAEPPVPPAYRHPRANDIFAPDTADGAILDALKTLAAETEKK